MRKFKKLAAAFSFILALSVAVPVQAEEVMNMGLKEIKAENNVLTAFVGNDLADRSIPVEYSVEVDGEQKNIVSVSSVKQENMGVSYVFLVDVSGSLTQKQSDEIKDTLKSLVEKIKDTDNACLMLLGDDAEALNFSGDKAELIAQIDAIEGKSEDTNLYYGINKALDVLAKSDAAQTLKCLVVLSDGQDDQKEGITKDEVDEKIDAAHITICTVVPEIKNQNTGKEEAAKLLGSFARRSPAGVHVLLGSAETTPETAAAAIAEAMDYTLVLKADISDFASDAKEVFVEVKANAEGYGSASDGYFVNSTVLTKGITVTEPKVPETEVEENVEENTENTAEGDKTEGAETEEASDGLTTEQIVIIAAAVIFLIVVIIILTNSSKKKKKAQAAKAQAQAVPNMSVTPIPITAEPKTGEPRTAAPEFAYNAPKQAAVAEKETEEPQKTEPTLKVTLSKVGLIETEEKEITVGKEFLIGRKPEKVNLAFPKDARVSGVHCRLSYNGSALFIEDLDSLNGTLVNGVPITRKYQLVSDDVISFGDNEWRIKI